MKAIGLLCLIVGLGVSGATMSLGQSAPQGGQPRRPILSELDRETQSLYQDISKSLVRVEVTQNPVAVLEPYNLKGEFDVWRKNREDANRGRDAGRPSRGPAGAGGNPPPAQAGPGPIAARGGGGPGRGGFGPGDMYGQLSNFLIEKANKSTDDPARGDVYRGLAVKVQISRSGYRGIMSAVVLDADGHILLPTGLLREATTSVDVTLPDGTQTTASFVGSNLYGEYSILQLAQKNGLTPIKWGPVPAPGQMLMPVSVGEGNPGSFVRPDRQGRFSLYGEDRSPALLFNIDGELTTLASAASGWTGDRQMLTAPRLEREIAYIKSGPDGKPTDIEPRSLGLGFDALSSLPSARATALAAKLSGRSAVVVTGVDTGSLADKAKLQVGDVILSIDSRPISELVSREGRQSPEMLQLRADLTTRTGSIAIAIIRGDQEQTVSMPLR